MIDKKHKESWTTMKLLIVVLVNITLFGAFISPADEGTETESPKVGDIAPDFLHSDF